MSLVRHLAHEAISRRALLRSAVAGGAGLAGLYAFGCDDGKSGPYAIYHGGDVLTMDAANSRRRRSRSLTDASSQPGQTTRCWRWRGRTPGGLTWAGWRWCQELWTRIRTS
jgi:hypothetical protein